MKCNDCGHSRGVRLCQGDLELCRKCEAKRFPPSSSNAAAKSQDNAKMADNGDNSQLTQIQSTLALLSEKIDKIPTVERKLSELQTSVEYISNFFDVYQKRMEEIQIENKNLKEQLEVVSGNMSTTQKELQDLQQYSRRNNLEIHGVPEHPDEDTDTIVKKVAEASGVNISKYDIDISHRLATKTHNENKPTPIIVKFTRRTVRNAIYNGKRNIKNKTSKDMNIDNDTQNCIYINESLTPSNRQLFNKVNEKKKALRWNYIWTYNGTIYVRRCQGDPAIKISSVQDINRMTNRQ
ncbi:uncharacterized protein LOC144432989 [Glandiceps talaboti]